MSIQSIHPTAIIDKSAQIGENTTIGAYCVIGPQVVLHDNVEVMSHVCIDGATTIGENTRIFPFAVIGFAPPDLKYRGENSKLIIGKNNVLREHVTIHTGTAVDRNETVIGDNCLLMANVHIAHDCILGNNIIMANCAALGGHVTIDDFAIIGGLSAIQQRVRIGAYAIVGGMSGVDGDLIPYGRAIGERARLTGLNTIGLKRRNISNAQISNMNKAYKQIFLENYDVFDQRVKDVANEFSDDEYIMKIVSFVNNNSNKSLCKPSNSEDNQQNAA